MQPRTIRLLVVDDDEGDRLQIIRCLEKADFACDVREATTVRSALEQVRHQKFDCIILDYQIPGRNGLDGVKSLLRVDPFLAIIMATGQGDEQVASAAIKLGARDYLAKARFTPSRLRDAVVDALHRSDIDRALADQQSALAIFSRVLVHDMKAPTQSILGFSRIADMYLDKEPIDREKLKGQMHRIADGALRMNAMLDQLHAYTEADAQPQFKNIRLDELLDGVVSNLDAVIGESGASVIFGGLPTICGDEEQLIQLLQNLVGNGIKYCKAEKPEIRIEAHNLDNGNCVIEVRDNGIGIDEKNFSAIFEPFRRLHSHGDFEGTGLGLTTCKKIVERHKGEIWCKSKVGEGTSFFFSVPLVSHGKGAAEDAA